VALLLTLYSGKTADEMLAIDPEAVLAPLDLKDHLTPQRSNGLASMITRIREIASQA
jgi:cysteine desulfuration protein SufE